MQKYQNNVQTLDGRAIVGASVTVTEFPGGAPATVYNSNGSGVITQPILTNGDGEFAFYAANGRYQLSVTGGGISVAQTITDIVLFDPAESVSDADDAGILTGAEMFPLSLGSGVLKTTLTAIAQWVQQTYAGFTLPFSGAVAQTQSQINAKDITTAGFGIPIDGVGDAYPKFQNALDAAAGGTLRVLAGSYKFISGSPKVPSNTRVIGEGRGKSILIQPNYYSYNRPTVPYDKAAVVDWNALWMDMDGSNIEISHLELRGPFWQPDAAGYTANPVQSWPASNGIFHRGNDYLFRKSLPLNTAEGFNVSVHDCHFEGWGEDAIQIDEVTNLQVFRNTVTRCARGGLRTYGVVHGWAKYNDISNLSPGDYLNGGNRMYGLEATRVYQAGCRPSEDIWFSFNRVRNCLQWKCMGTHGGRRIRFLYNDCLDSHHGIGVDKGGTNETEGISPPSDIVIAGNRVRRVAAGDPTEGDGEGGAGQGLFITAHDGTDTHRGNKIQVYGNTIEGWGSENLNGGIWIGNWDNVSLGDNTYLDNFGSAIRLRDTIKNISIGPQVIRGVTRSAGGNQRGISVETGNISGTIAPCNIENTDLVNTMTAFFLGNNDGTQGMYIAHGQRLVGLVNLMNLPNNELGGGVQLVPAAVGHILVSGGTASIRVGKGLVSVTYEGAGSYLITLQKSASSTNNLAVTASILASARGISWTAVSTNSFRVNTYATGSATLTDNSFSFAAYLF